jgi:hypothetical protein
MSNISVQLRRGTDTEHSSFTGAEGEVTVDTTNDTLRVHDGTTAGGIRLAKHSELSAGGGGTVVSIASGTGLTGGPITTSGTLSLASIANLRALGNVSGVSAAPVAVEIKDDDSMSTASATSLATSESIKAYVDTQVAASTVSKYSSGWVNTDGSTSVANAALLTFTHNLSTTDLTVTVYAADDSSGTNPFLISPTDSITGASRGAQVNAISTTQVSLRLGANGFLTLNSSGVNTGVSWASKYIKVVVIG